ncbi:mercury resistance system transport protein MerF [Halomonas campisalis]|nr:mercury resistance system transport protein MerF [Halomonas campisalis]MDR5862817.1 mercury resistance system transport protein MerF [Halomonas campisalis]
MLAALIEEQGSEALTFFIGLTLYAIWRKKQYDACCVDNANQSRHLPHE